MPVARVSQSVGQFTVIGQHHQAGTFGVQASDHEQVLIRVDEIEDGLAFIAPVRFRR